LETGGWKLRNAILGGLPRPSAPSRWMRAIARYVLKCSNGFATFLTKRQMRSQQQALAFVK
jgi:hypothetical protein